MVCLVAVSVISVACVEVGGEPSPTIEGSTTTTTAAPDAPSTTLEALEATRAFETCMIDSGVDMEPVAFDAQGRPRLDLMMKDVDLADPGFGEALSTCAETLLLGALDLSGSPIVRQAVLSMLTEFSVCMRGKGVPDFPNPSGDFVGIGPPYPPSLVPYSDPDLEDAVAVCGSRLALAVVESG